MRCLKNVSGEMHRVLSFFFTFYFFPKLTLGYRSCKIMRADFSELGLLMLFLHLLLLACRASLRVAFQISGEIIPQTSTNVKTRELT